MLIACAYHKLMYWREGYDILNVTFISKKNVGPITTFFNFVTNFGVFGATSKHFLNEEI